MTKTPKGPWVTRGSSVYIKGTQLRVCKVQIDQSFGHKISQQEAEISANLISAAPEILEALKALMESTEDFFTDEDSVAVYGQCRKAIAKAEGRE